MELVDEMVYRTMMKTIETTKRMVNLMKGITRKFKTYLIYLNRVWPMIKYLYQYVH